MDKIEIRVGKCEYSVYYDCDYYDIGWDEIGVVVRVVEIVNVQTYASIKKGPRWNKVAQAVRERLEEY